MTKNRKQPQPRRFDREKAEEIAVRIFDVHRCKRHRIINTRGGIGLDAFSANSPEEKQIRVNLPFQVFSDLLGLGPPGFPVPYTCQRWLTAVLHPGAPRSDWRLRA